MKEYKTTKKIARGHVIVTENYPKTKIIIIYGCEQNKNILEDKEQRLMENKKNKMRKKGWLIFNFR